MQNIHNYVITECKFLAINLLEIKEHSGTLYISHVWFVAHKLSLCSPNIAFELLQSLW